MEIETKFYTYLQEKTNGYFITNEQKGIGKVVIIEETSAERANNKAEQINLYFNGVELGIDSPYYGDRWYRCNEWNGEKEPMVNGLCVNDYRDTFKYDGYIHYINGTIENF